MNTRKLMAKADALKKNKKNKKGFTLVELIVVLVILAILMAILIPTMSGYIKRANKTSDQSACKTAYTAVSAAITDSLSTDPSADDDTIAKALGGNTAVKAGFVPSDPNNYIQQYIDSSELAKIKKVSVSNQAVAQMIYEGNKFDVQVTVDGTGAVSYKFKNKGASSGNFWS